MFNFNAANISRPNDGHRIKQLKEQSTTYHMAEIRLDQLKMTTDQNSLKDTPKQSSKTEDERATISRL